jgi:hypothetical protein
MCENEAAASETIVCKVTPWYYRRMGLLSLMFVAMGAYFCYDGKFGYPKANKIADEKEWYDKVVLASYDVEAAKGEEAAKAWMDQARAKGWVLKADLKEPRWDDYAAPHGWASKPKKYSPDEINQQFQWGGAMFLGAFITGVLVLLSRGKSFVGHADHMIMPDGKLVKFAEVFKVDKRKWDNKGLAYAFYRQAEGATEKKATIDDLKYDGAGKVLDRLLANFSGELIEKVAEPEEEEEKSEEVEQIEKA